MTPEQALAAVADTPALIGREEAETLRTIAHVVMHPRYAVAVVDIRINAAGLYCCTRSDVDAVLAAQATVAPALLRLAEQDLLRIEEAGPKALWQLCGPHPAGLSQQDGRFVTQQLRTINTAVRSGLSTIRHELAQKVLPTMVAERQDVLAAARAARRAMRAAAQRRGSAQLFG